MEEQNTVFEQRLKRFINYVRSRKAETLWLIVLVIGVEIMTAFIWKEENVVTTNLENYSILCAEAKRDLYRLTFITSSGERLELAPKVSDCEYYRGLFGGERLEISYLKPLNRVHKVKMGHRIMFNDGIAITRIGWYLLASFIFMFVCTAYRRSRGSKYNQ